MYFGWAQPWEHGLKGPHAAAIWPVCIERVQSLGFVQALQMCVTTHTHTHTCSAHPAVYRVQGLDN